MLSEAHPPVHATPGPAVTISLDASELTRLIETTLEGDDHALTLRLLEAGLKIQPDNVDFLVEASICLRALERMPEALALLERASQLDTSGNASIELGWLAAEVRDYKTAKRALIHALQCHPENLDEIHYDAPFWKPIRYDLDVMQAIERAANTIANTSKTRQTPAPKHPTR